MKVLLVEDDEDKREQLSLFIKERIRCDLIEVRSFQKGLKAIKETYFDLILLDMTLPTFDITPTDSGGRSQPFGGEMLLSEMQRRNIATKVIMVTQFDLFGKGEEAITLRDLDIRLSSKFPVYLGAVQYSLNYSGWKDSLYGKIEKAGLLKTI